MSKAAQERYDRENTIRVTIKLNKKTDAEIIELLSSAPSKQGLIKKNSKKLLQKHLTIGNTYDIMSTTKQIIMF